MRKIFITGTGTGIGKTFVTAALAHQLKGQGEPVQVIKPIITGWNESGDNDTQILLAATGLPSTSENIASCSPWRFTAPLAADMAAAREGRKIDFAEVVTFCNRPLTGIKLIEGAGGVMSPVSEGRTFLDLIKSGTGEVILVTGTYLGSISHTLTALEALRDLEVRLIVNESPESEISSNDTVRSIANYTKAPIILLPRCKSWKDAPDIFPA